MFVRLHSLPLLLLVLVAFVSASSPLKKDKLPAQIILIRHGEKGDEPINLDPAGYKRADCLVDYFTNPKASYNTPDVIYAMKQHNEDSGNRPVETVTPLADALNLDVIDKFKKGDESDAAEEILTKYPGKTVLACWEHKALVDLALAVGACTKKGTGMEWGLNPESGSDDSNCYNGLWLFDYGSNQNNKTKTKTEDVTFTVYAQFDVVPNGNNNYECVYKNDPSQIYFQRDCEVTPPSKK